VNRWFLLLLPSVAGVVALSTGRLPFKLAVAGLCAVIVLHSMRGTARARTLHLWAVVVALVMSMVGDYFLSSRSGHPHYFEAGIAAFFAAHLGFLRYALANGRLHKVALAILLGAFVPYCALALSPAIEGAVLWVAVWLYLLVSCVGLAAAFGLKQPLVVKILYVAGIGSLVFSDTLISLSEFLHWRAFNALILPTYYLAHLAVTASILAGRQDAPGTVSDPRPSCS